jgi:beta-lactamase regulating signal transducer with metallopeptidase domain
MTIHDVIELLWRSTLMMSMAIICTVALRLPVRRWLGAQAAYLLWVLPPLALLASLLPAPVRTLSMMHNVGLIVPQSMVDPMPALAHAEGVATMGPGSIIPESTVVLVWAAGVLLMLLILTQQQRHYMKKLGKLLLAQPGIWRSQHKDISPCLVGALRPRIVLPGAFESQYSAVERKLIVAHELIHLRHGDAQINALAAILRSVFWFNPLMHLATGRLRFDQELACDATLITRFPQARRPYADAMLKVQLAGESRQELRLPVGCYWPSGNPLKERIMMLKQPVFNRARRMVSAALALTLSFAGSYIAWAVQPPADSAPGPDAQLIKIANLQLTFDGETIFSETNGGGIVFQAGDQPGSRGTGIQSDPALVVEFRAKPLEDGRIEVFTAIASAAVPGARHEIIANLSDVVATDGGTIHLTSTKALSGHDIDLEATVSAHPTDFACEERVGESPGRMMFELTPTQPLAPGWDANTEAIRSGKLYLSPGFPIHFEAMGPTRDEVKFAARQDGPGTFAVTSTWHRVGMVAQKQTYNIAENEPSQIKINDSTGAAVFELDYTLSNTRTVDKITENCKAVAEKFPVIRLGGSSTSTPSSVVVRALIDTNGRATEAAIAAGYGKNPADAEAEQQALDLVRNYQFAVPTSVMGAPESKWVLVSVPTKYTPNGFAVDVSG